MKERRGCQIGDSERPCAGVARRMRDSEIRRQ